MPGVKIELDHGGIAEILKSAAVGAMVDEAASQVAANVEAQGQMVNGGRDVLPVVLDSYVTDRQARSVTLAHPAGLAVQAKHGTLTRAAADAGLEVTERA